MRAISNPPRYLESTCWVRCWVKTQTKLINNQIKAGVSKIYPTLRGQRVVVPPMDPSLGDRQPQSAPIPSPFRWIHPCVLWSSTVLSSHSWVGSWLGYKSSWRQPTPRWPHWSRMQRKRTAEQIRPTKSSYSLMNRYLWRVAFNWHARRFFKIYVWFKQIINYSIRGNVSAIECFGGKGRGNRDSKENM